ncbi:MAG: hypothetical protein U0X41_02440 [Chitinophagales bacterium]
MKKRHCLFIKLNIKKKTNKYFVVKISVCRLFRHIDGITLERLRKRGYISMLEMYDELNPLLNEPPYTRPVRTVV